VRDQSGRAKPETLPHPEDRQLPTIPHPGPIKEQEKIHGKSGALRAAIFGLNDGLVSNFALIFGVAGSGVSGNVVVIAGVAGLVAGAFSMGAGEYVSMRVQREVFEEAIHEEAHELAADPEAELRELVEIYRRRGVDPEVAEQISRAEMEDPRIALETHAREELGLDMHQGLGSPWAAAASSFVMFSLGAIVPLLPFLFLSRNPAVVLSGVLSALTLFAVGAAMTVLTGRGFFFSGLRMLAIGAGVAAITFAVGEVVGVVVS
jgi:vacuolar iron transporter family protein